MSVDFNSIQKTVALAYYIILLLELNLIYVDFNYNIYI